MFSFLPLFHSEGQERERVPCLSRGVPSRQPAVNGLLSQRTPRCRYCAQIPKPVSQSEHTTGSPAALAASLAHAQQTKEAMAARIRELEQEVSDLLHAGTQSASAFELASASVPSTSSSATAPGLSPVPSPSPPSSQPRPARPTRLASLRNPPPRKWKHSEW